MRRLLYIAFLTTVLVLIACGPAVPEYRLVTAQSGRQLKIEDVSKIARPDGQTAMFLAYRSDVYLTDLSALHVEFDEVLQIFRPQVERN